jgi:hypothetical protein
MHKVFAGLVVGVLGSWLWISPQVAFSQTDAVKPSVRTLLEGTEMVPIYYATPSLLAWWLDPSRVDEPVAKDLSGTTREPIEWILGPRSSIADGTSVLPDAQPTVGVYPVDGLGAIFLKGPAPDIAAMKKRIALLDQPHPLITVNATFIQVEDEELRKLGLKTLPALKVGKEGTPATEQDTEKSLAQTWGLLKPLLDTGKARILEGQGYVTISRTPLRIRTSSGGPSSLVLSSLPPFNGNAPAIDSVIPFKAETRDVLALLPILETDGSISLEVILNRSLALGQEGPVGKVITEIPVCTRLRIKNGESVVLTGLTTRIFDSFFGKSGGKDSNLVLLVSARFTDLPFL